jgi:hypothetical protein
MNELKLEKDVWIPVEVAKEHAKEMEAFLKTNYLPYMRGKIRRGYKVYQVRAGMDYNDTMYFILSTWGDPEGADVEQNIIDYLFRCEHAEIKYEYEHYGRRCLPVNKHGESIDGSLSDRLKRFLNRCMSSK